MAETRLVLHIGAPKCGSTAIQTTLAHNPEFRSATGEKFQYAVLDGRGQVHTRAAVRQRAMLALSGGAPSAGAEALSALNGSDRQRIAERLNAELATTSVILSQEGWMERPHLFEAPDLLRHIRKPIDVFAYVRPQPEFLNAAWWQWGAWNRPSFARWMEVEKLEFCKWGDLLQAWRSFPNVRAVTPRLMSGDVVADFFGLLGCEAPRTRIANRSLPGSALRFLQRNRELRPGRADVDMHFVLERALAHFDDATPWVLPADYIAHVLETSAPSNRVLAALLDPQSRAAMEADKRWWDAAAYAGKSLEPGDTMPADAETAERLAVALAKRLLALERELAAMNARSVRPWWSALREIAHLKGK